MRIYRHLGDREPQHENGVVAIGNFDGVHLGHQTVIGEAGKIAESLGAPWGVMTFEPHPRQVFQPDGAPFRLTPFRAKANAVETLGADFIVAMRFSMDFSRQHPVAFIEDCLIKGLAVKHVVTGYDFRFGHKREGSCETLLAEGRRLGFDFTVVSAASDDGGGLYSSSRVREFLSDGDMRGAADVLGRPYRIEGPVRHGDKRGRTIGFPTANMESRDQMPPKFGVYAVRVRLPNGSRLDAVSNFGMRPTVGGEAPRLEVHLFDFDADLYGERIAVDFIDMVRPEKKFDGLDALKAQIARDCEDARRILADTP